VSAAELTRYGSPRLAAYGVVTALGLLGAVLTGRAELVALVAPIALVLVGGIVLADTPRVDATVTLDADRVIEGDRLNGSVTVAPSTPSSRVEVLVSLRGPVDVLEPATGALWWSGSGTVMRRPLALRLAPRSWGIVGAGPVWVRVHGPLGLIGWQGHSTTVAAARVLPRESALAELLRPDEARVVAGSHIARWRGDGLEFAEVRPYAVGDRLRTINWSVSARRDQLWVNQRHPERSADLVLLLDTFADDRSGASAALVRAVRAAWMLAVAHLGAHDRVGVVTFGGYPAWLAPGGGTRAQYAICDRLLAASPAWSEAQRSVNVLPRRAIPPGALVVGLTPLHDGRMVSALADLRHRGMEIAAVEIDVGVEVGAASRERGLPDAAVRLWRLEQARRRRALAGVGIPVVPWPANDDVALVLDGLARARRRAMAAR
jgi:uncharacterized protein (DUF58 family)